MPREIDYTFLLKSPREQWEEFMKLSYEERTYFLSKLTPQVVMTINSMIPGIPYIQYLKHLIETDQYVTPTVEHLRDFRDAFSDGKISFPRNV